MKAWNERTVRGPLGEADPLRTLSRARPRGDGTAQKAAQTKGGPADGAGSGAMPPPATCVRPLPSAGLGFAFIPFRTKDR